MNINKKPLFNENGDIEVSKKRMINGNTTNLNDFNNMKYGTKMHYILETTSFNETSEKIVNNLLKSL